MNTTFNNRHKIPSLILGTYKYKNYATLKEIVNASIKMGIIGFDTAPSYKTEKILGRIINESLYEFDKKREEFFVSTKIDAWQMQDSDGEIERYVDNILKYLEMDYLDQLLIHWPIPEYFDKTWKSFIKIFNKGKVKVIGVCNVRERHLLKLMDSEIIPMVVQNERHPLRTDEDTFKFCRDNKIIYEAYSPVGQMMEQISNSQTLQKLSSKYDKSIGQIIMRWHIDTGSIPVFMTTKPQRIKEYTEIFNFSLANEDVHIISSLNTNYKIFLESLACPGF